MAEQDSRILELFASGQQRAGLELLVRTYQQRVFSFCLREHGNRTQAEDLTQQVFIEAARDIRSFQGHSKLSTWLLQIAAHRAADARKASRRRELALVRAEQQATTEAWAVDGVEQQERREILRALRDCYASLEESHRLVIDLRCVERLTFVEMSSVMKEEASTLQQRWTRALPRLRKCLESKGVTW